MNREPASKRDLSIKEDSRIILQGIFILFYVNKCFVLPAHMSVHRVQSWYLRRSECGGGGFPGPGVASGHEHSCGCWVSVLGPLQEQVL